MSFALFGYTPPKDAVLQALALQTTAAPCALPPNDGTVPAAVRVVHVGGGGEGAGGLGPAVSSSASRMLMLVTPRWHLVAMRKVCESAQSVPWWVTGHGTVPEAGLREAVQVSRLGNQVVGTLFDWKRRYVATVEREGGEKKWCLV